MYVQMLWTWDLDIHTYVFIRLRKSTIVLWHHKLFAIHILSLDRHMSFVHIFLQS